MTRHAQHGVAATSLITWCVFAILVVWQLYKGLSIQEIGYGPLTFKFGKSGNVEVPAPPARQFSLTGTWAYISRSSVNTLGCQRSMRLTMDGNQVSGVMSPCDDSKTGVEGTFNGSTLTLSRDTGMNTTQKFVLTKRSDNIFNGNYWNEGAAKDEGLFEIQR